MHLQQGTLLQGGKYRIEKLIGNDSYNAVYLATQCLSQNTCVINELDGVYSDETGRALKERFLQEGKLLSELNHKYIVRCIDIFEEGNAAYYVTKFADGVNLRNYQEVSTRFDITLWVSEQRSIEIMKLIAEALDYLHKQGICHLDVKPSNIMYKHVHNEWYSGEIEPDSITLLDFGCARSYNGQGKLDRVEMSTEIMAGTPGYAPLELGSPCSKISPATDIYALGATWYYLLTGKRPPSAIEVLENGGINEIRGASPKVNNAIRAAMNPQMKHRPQSISEFLALFDEKLDDPSEETSVPDFEVEAETPNEPQQALTVGMELIGPSYTYVIKKVLGQGGFGITYLASVKLKGLLGTLDSEMKVAIKEFYMRDYCMRDNSGSVSFTDSSKGSISKKYTKKFVKEALHLSKLHHSNIVKVAESFEYNNTSYCVMEYLDGQCLDDYVAANMGLSEYEAITYIRQIGAALSYMHSHELLHMDVKPKNVMLKDGHCVLIDFGLAKQYDEHGQPESSTGLGAGTAGYAPLEQMHYSGDKEFAPTIDVYALGATLYKMLTSETPPPASVILNDGLDRSVLEDINVSSDTIDLIAMAMEPMKKKRIQTIDEFLALLPNEETINQHGDSKRRASSEETVISEKNNSARRYGVEEINGIPVRWSSKASDYQKKVIRQLLGRMRKLRDDKYVLINDFVSTEEFNAVISQGGTTPNNPLAQETVYAKPNRIMHFLTTLNSLTQVIGGFTIMDIKHFYNDDYTFADEKEDILMTKKEMSIVELIEAGNAPEGLQKVCGYKRSCSPLGWFEYRFGAFRFKIMIDSHLFYSMYKRPDET